MSAGTPPEAARAAGSDPARASKRRRGPASVEDPSGAAGHEDAKQTIGFSAAGSACLSLVTLRARACLAEGRRWG
eukprot:10539327-Alexandrium_andersonii.AAC.1